MCVPETWCAGGQPSEAGPCLSLGEEVPGPPTLLGMPLFSAERVKVTSALVNLINKTVLHGGHYKLIRADKARRSRPRGHSHSLAFRRGPGPGSGSSHLPLAGGWCGGGQRLTPSPRAESLSGTRFTHQPGGSLKLESVVAGARLPPSRLWGSGTREMPGAPRGGSEAKLRGVYSPAWVFWAQELCTAGGSTGSPLCRVQAGSPTSPGSCALLFQMGK